VRSSAGSLFAPPYDAADLAGPVALVDVSNYVMLA
jgi:hypothetical protein